MASNVTRLVTTPDGTSILVYSNRRYAGNHLGVATSDGVIDIDNSYTSLVDVPLFDANGLPAESLSTAHAGVFRVSTESGDKLIFQSISDGAITQYTLSNDGEFQWRNFEETTNRLAWNNSDVGRIIYNGFDEEGNPVISEILNDYENNVSVGEWSLAGNRKTKAYANSSAAFGYNTTVGVEGDAEQGQCSFAEGANTVVTAMFAHAEGSGCLVQNAELSDKPQPGKTGKGGHAEGIGTLVTGEAGHAEGKGSRALDTAAHGEGRNSWATAEAAHAEGLNTRAEGVHSHSEGDSSRVTIYSKGGHAEGYHTEVGGNYSHAEGYETKVNKNIEHAHVQGRGTVAYQSGQFVFGTYNSIDTSNQYLCIAGNGSDASNLSNAYTLNKTGDAWFAGELTLGSSKDPVALKKQLNDYVTLDKYNKYIAQTASTLKSMQSATSTLESKVENLGELTTSHSTQLSALSKNHNDLLNRVDALDDKHLETSEQLARIQTSLGDKLDASAVTIDNGYLVVTIGEQTMRFAPVVDTPAS